MITLGLDTVVVAGLAAGLFWLRLRLSFGNGSGLALAGTAQFVELLLQLDDASLQSDDAALELLTTSAVTA